MPARSPKPVTATLLRKREEWLNAILAGDIKAAIKASGDKPDGSIGLEFQQTGIDAEIGDRVFAMLEEYRDPDDAARKSLQSWFDDICLQRSPDLPYYNASPVEVLLRESRLDELKQVLNEWASPRQRYLRGIIHNPNDIGWTSTWSLPRKAKLSSGFDRIPLVTLAAIRGDNEAMKMLVHAGLCPSYHGWWDESDRLLNLAKEKKAVPDLPKALKQYGMARGGLKAAAERVDRMQMLDQQLEEVFEPKNYKSGGRKKAFSLLKKGAPVGYYALGVATEEGDLEMLEALFAGGGDPNCVYKNGIPMLAKVSKAPLDAVKVWLRHGACPLMKHDPAEPNFGDDWRPSPLYEAVWEGNLELTRLLLEEAVIRPVITYKEGKKSLNPMAELAKERGHTQLEAYLKDYAAAMKA